MPDIRTKEGQRAYTKIVCEVSGKCLDCDERHLVQQNEIDGIKEKLLQVSTDFYSDRKTIKTSLATFKEQEIKINDIVSKTKEIMGFVHNFKQFEDRIDKGLGELYKKDKEMSNEFTGRLNLLDDL